MKALVFHRPGKVSVDTVPDPTIEKPDDVILPLAATGRKRRCKINLRTSLAHRR